MGTLKKSKLWYACEGSTLIYPLNMTYKPRGGYTPSRANNYYNSIMQGVHNYGIDTPSWKDINGNTYTHLAFSRIIEWHEGSNESGDMGCNWTMRPRKSFQYTIPYLCDEDILDYDIDEYDVTNVISNLDILDYEIAYINSGESSGVTISINVSNNTQNDIDVNCIKFTKNVDVFSDISKIDSNYLNPLEISNNVESVSGLYVSYYFDSQEQLTVYSGETKIISFIIIPDDTLVVNASIKKTKTWKAYEQLRLAPFHGNSEHPYIAINVNDSTNMGVNHRGIMIETTNDQTFFKESNARESIAQQYTYCGWEEIDDFVSNYWGYWGAQTRMLSFPHCITPIFVFDRGIENHSELITDVPFITEPIPTARSRKALGFSNIQSKLYFTENEMAIYFYIYLTNVQYENGYTAKSILFCRPLYPEGYYSSTGGNYDKKVMYQYNIDGSENETYEELNAKVFYPYVYFYLTNPVVVPYGKTRIITVKITPEKIEVQNNGG